MPALVVGWAVIGVCLVLPQVEANRRVRYDLDRLRAEQARIEDQIKVNDEFLAKVSVDPTLMARLAQRQLRLVPGGMEPLELSGMSGESRNPFQLVTVPPVPAQAPYQPFGGEWLAPVMDDRKRLYLLAGSFLLVAMGLILDGGRRRVEPEVSAAEPKPATEPLGA